MDVRARIQGYLREVSFEEGANVDEGDLLFVIEPEEYQARVNRARAALAVALLEAATPEFKDYAHAIVQNAKALAEALLEGGFGVVSGGTDNHLVLFDATPRGITGKPLAVAMNRAGLVANYNNIPFDPRPPMEASGIRIGTAAVTTRGLGEDDMRAMAGWIADLLAAPEDEAVRSRIRGEVAEVANANPLP